MSSIEIIKIVVIKTLITVVLFVFFVMALRYYGYDLIIQIEEIQQDNVTIVYDGIVKIDRQLVDELNKIYNDEKPNEYVVCLEGGVNLKGEIIITDFYKPTIVEATETEVIYKSCNVGSIGTLHSHPDGICELSRQDIYTFGATKQLLTCVQCREDVFGCFTPTSLDKRLKVIIE